MRESACPCRPALRVCIGLVLAVVIGCSRSPTWKGYPVTGKVVLRGGDVAQLAGGYVRFESVADPNVRGVGQIDEDGTFIMGWFFNDKPVAGLLEGTYRAKIDPPVAREA